MMLAIVAESALRSLLLGAAVWIGLHLLRVRNPHVQMTSWVMVLLASLSMPLLMHWTTVTIALHPSPVPARGAGSTTASAAPGRSSPPPRLMRAQHSDGGAGFEAGMPASDCHPRA